MYSRRWFLSASAVAALGSASYAAWKWLFRVRGQMHGPAADIGHVLRGDLSGVPKPSSEEKIPIVIVGGGVSGLTAAWQLQQLGMKDFRLFELDSVVGGTSASGENEASKFPWGAHYVPIPSHEGRELQTFLKEIGVITDVVDGLPVYNPDYLVIEPQDRLMYQGRWYRGSVPEHGASMKEKKQLYDFTREMIRLRGVHGKDGKRAFAIPVERSSRDPEWMRLDTITMKDWLIEKGWTDFRVHYWVNFCCRDDFGTPYDQTSAWTGIHYFAARGGESANIRGEGMLSWPNGNGWLVEKLEEKSRDHITKRALVTTVRPKAKGAEVEVYFPDEKRTLLVHAEAVIFAGPRFVAGKVIEPWRKDPPKHIRAFQYTPWLVANFTLDSLPQSPFGEAELAWDNDRYESDSLGYVVATHRRERMNPTTEKRSTVITQYWPLDDKPAADARKAARETQYAQWVEKCTADLEAMHPGIRSQILNVDICVWGHGMIRCPPGFMWGEDRLQALQPLGDIFFSHSDMSGMCLFEEAHYRGVNAATEALRATGRTPKA